MTNRYQEGWEVYSVDDEKVGKISEVYADYVLVEKGWLFKKDLYIPTSAFSRTDANEGVAYLNVAKDQIESMAWDTAPATRGGVGETATSRGTASTDTVRLHEEELAARKEQVQAGEVELGKRVVTEHQTMDVPVTHDEVSIERRAVDRRPAESEIGEDDTSVRVPLMEEQVEVEKRPVVTEEVSVHKTPVTETRRVSETVRREEAVVNRDGVASGVQGATHEHRLVDGRCADCGYTE